jgi:hypothetical protein
MSDRAPPSPFRGPTRPSGGPRAREVKEWVRQGVGAPDDATIVVSELFCSEPGCPPYEVVLAVLQPGKPPRQRKLHRRLAELTETEVLRLWQASGDDHPVHEGEVSPALADAPDRTVRTRSDQHDR